MASLLGKLPDFLYERPEGVVRVRGMKLLLEGVIYLHRDGITPNDMIEAYSDLDPRIAAKIVAYYERNREAVDEYVAQAEREWEEDRRITTAWQASPEFQKWRKAAIQSRKRGEPPPYDMPPREAFQASPEPVR